MNKIDQIKIGEFFNIENTPTYPKLRTKSGYIDFRDEIVNDNPSDWDVTPMTLEEVAKILDVKWEVIIEELALITKKFNNKF